MTQAQISVKKKKERKTYLGGGVDTLMLGHVLCMHVDVDRCKENIKLTWSLRKMNVNMQMCCMCMWMEMSMKKGQSKIKESTYR